MSGIFDFILKTNTFNFAILFLCIALIAHYLKLGGKFEDLKNAIIKKIEDAKLERENAINNLNSAKNAVANLAQEIEEKLSGAKVSAGNVAAKIQEETGNDIEGILKNSENIISSEEKSMSSEMLKKASEKAIELSREYLKSELAKRRDLHEKFIRESIDKLDRINL